MIDVLGLVAARWMWKGQQRGGRLALLLTVAGAPFWIGFMLPHWLVAGPARALLLWRAWSSLRQGMRLQLGIEGWRRTWT